jgi:hypothetical protein
VFFQGGAAAVDTSTIIATLVHGMTGSSFAVGAAIARYGWLFPQLIVGYVAQRRRRRLPFYMFGAFGRVTCLAAVASLLAFAGDQPGSWTVCRNALRMRLRFLRRSGTYARARNLNHALGAPSAGISESQAARGRISYRLAAQDLCCG